MSLNVLDAQTKSVTASMLTLCISLHPSIGERGLQGHTGLPGAPGSPGSQGLQGPPGPTAGGVVYTRWGRTTCPSTSGTQLLYSGRAGGTWYSHSGGGANYLCLPDNPEYLQHTTGSYNHGYLYGAEYETGGPDNGPLSAVNDHNVPCAVCYVPTRGTMVMIPAKTTCPTSWTREYYGYLMANYYAFHRTMYECVDKDPESIPGSAINGDGTRFYHVETRCNGIPCPPYQSEKEVTCTVCTK